MSQSNSGGKSFGRSTQGDQASIDEQNQRIRLHTIHDDRERTADIKSKSELKIATEEFSEFEVNCFFRSVVERYAIQVRSLMVSEEQYEEYWFGDEDDPLGEFELPDGEEIVIEGLKDLVEAPNPYVVTTTHIPPSPPGRSSWPSYQIHEVVEEKRQQVQVPRDILLAAYFEVNDFIHDVGLDIKLNESLHETRITREMLEEVREWTEKRGLEYNEEKDEMAIR